MLGKNCLERQISGTAKTSASVSTQQLPGSSGRLFQCVILYKLLSDQTGGGNRIQPNHELPDCLTFHQFQSHA